MPRPCRSCGRSWPTATALRPPCWTCSRGCSSRPDDERQTCRRSSDLPLDHHPFDLGNGLRRVEVFRASLGAVHDGVAAVEAERILEIVEALAGRLIAAVDQPAPRVEQGSGAKKAVAIPPVARARGGAA